MIRILFLEFNRYHPWYNGRHNCKMNYIIKDKIYCSLHIRREFDLTPTNLWELNIIKTVNELKEGHSLKTLKNDYT